jgi:hypothetical protein
MAFALSLPLLSDPAGGRESQELRVGIVVDGPGYSYDLAVQIEAELEALLGDRYHIDFPEEAIFAGDFSAAGARSALDAALSHDDLDLVLGFGPAVGSEATSRESLPGLVILPLAIPLEFHPLPRDRDSSGIGNLNYIAGLTNFARDLRSFLEVAEFRRMALVVDAHILATVPGLESRMVEAGSS